MSDVKRLYLKDTQLGSIFAVAVDTGAGKPVIIGMKLCSKAEELVAGALAVMPLETIDVDLASLQTLYDERKLFPWQPPEAPSPTMHKLIDLREKLGKAQARTKAAAEKHKSAKADESGIEQQIFAVLATLHEPEPGLPFDEDGNLIESQIPEGEVGNVAFDAAKAEFVPNPDAVPVDDVGNPEPEDLGDENAPGEQDAADPEREGLFSDEDPGPDPMDVAEVNRDLDDHLSRQGEHG